MLDILFHEVLLLMWWWVKLLGLCCCGCCVCCGVAACVVLCYIHYYFIIIQYILRWRCWWSDVKCEMWCFPWPMCSMICDDDVILRHYIDISWVMFVMWCDVIPDVLSIMLCVIHWWFYIWWWCVMIFLWCSVMCYTMWCEVIFMYSILYMLWCSCIIPCECIPWYYVTFLMKWAILLPCDDVICGVLYVLMKWNVDLLPHYVLVKCGMLLLSIYTIPYDICVIMLYFDVMSHAFSDDDHAPRAY